MLGVVIFLYAKLFSRIIVIARAVPFEEGRKFLSVRLFDSELYGVVDFFACADAFEWLCGIRVN